MKPVIEVAEKIVNNLDKLPAKKPKLPLGMQSFIKLIGGDFIYVDKTGFIKKLINSGLTYFFLSRPRRFGKSLLVSTMKEVFSGNRQLFKGLDIYEKIDWQTYPVIFLDFTLIAENESISVDDALAGEVDKIAGKYSLPVTPGNHKNKFRMLIENLYEREKKRVVVLIDEYDKFIIDHITDEKQRRDLKDFFSVLKGLDEYLRFVFITGVSRFTQISIFSDLNNLIDLTFDPDYAAAAGYTEAELLEHFYFFIHEFAKKNNYTFDHLLTLIRKWYNGYSWDSFTRIYNPFSILKLFSDYRFADHWFATGTPTFLIETIRQRKTKIQDLDNIVVKRSRLENMEVSRLDLIPLLFQTGYLTITRKIKTGAAGEEFLLGYPNKDVRYSFLNHLLEDFSEENRGVIDRISAALKENRVADALESMKGVFAGVPYDHFDHKKESSYHALVHVIFYLILDNIGSEIHTNLGKIDSVIETDDYIYIFEFKMEDARSALDQIYEKKYYEKYEPKGKEIVLIGSAFSTENRNIGDWLIEPLNKGSSK